jgi:hypothetical protein
MPAEMKSVDGSSGGGISENDGNRRWSRASHPYYQNTNKN